MSRGKSYNGAIHGTASVQESVNRDPVTAIVAIAIVRLTGNSLIISGNKPHVI